MARLGIDLRRLPTQLILSFTGLVLLTAVATGLPAIWLIRGQLERRAWAQVEQAGSAAGALYAAKQNEMANLATLTAQRPTLRRLLAQGDQASLVPYLGTLQSGASLDLVLVCDAQERTVGMGGDRVSDDLCGASTAAGFRIVTGGEGDRQVWLLAAQPVTSQEADDLGQVIVGTALDDAFADRMRAHTGLDHTLLVDGRPAATSLGGDRERVSHQVVPSGRPDDAARRTFSLGADPYYALTFPLAPPSEEAGRGTRLEAEVALPVADITAAKRRLVWALVGSIVGAAAVGSVLGVLVARRIGRPLAQLTEAAARLRHGNLDAPVDIEARVREVSLVAEALERARVDLQHSLANLRQEKAWTDHLLESIVEGIVTQDGEGRITFFSPGAERITGWSREEVLNRSCDQVFQPVEGDRPFCQGVPAPGKRHKTNVRLAHGRLATLAVTQAELMPPEAGGAQLALVFRDVSEEEIVHRHVGHFLANIAHEFRTPLSALAASVELLLDQAPQLGAAELQELLTSLHLGILGLQTLVDNLLESASIEAGRFKVQARPSTNLREIIAEAIRTMQPLVDKRGQHLVLELTETIPPVRADWRRTVQVLVNLLSNASKYGPDGAEITVGATADEGWVRVEVADRGPGVVPQDQGDPFRRLVRPESDEERLHRGMGLGLSVVKAVIDAHGGQVGVEDNPGGGSIFWFTLPVEGEC